MMTMHVNAPNVVAEPRETVFTGLPVGPKGRDNEQVHGGNVWSMITQEGSPSLAGWPPSPNHVLGNARLRDLKPELEQFAVDTWRTPKRIFDAHPPDQSAQLDIDLRSPSQWA
jgi:hypothetical protein